MLKVVSPYHKIMVDRGVTGAKCFWLSSSQKKWFPNFGEIRELKECMYLRSDFLSFR